VVAALLREPWWPAERLRPVRGEPRDVLRVLAGMGERVVQLGVGEAPRVMRRCEGEERGLTPGEGEERRAHRVTVPLGGGPVTAQEKRLFQNSSGTEL
jgi:hypothetical protein